MNVTSVCLCVLISSLSLVSGQNLKSPCSGVFEFDNDVAKFGHDGGKLYGTISLIKKFDETPVSALEVKIYFSVEGPLLNNNYKGNVSPLTAYPVRMYNQGQRVTYRVLFPPTELPPKVSTLSLNGKTICQVLAGTFGEHTTIISLRHKSKSNGPVDKTVTVSLVSGSTQSTRPTQADHSPTPAPVTSVTYSLGTPQNSVITSDECGLVAGGNQRVPLINNGQFYERGEMPWLVAIYRTVANNLNFICGGTLVSDRHVVTAGHCFNRRNAVTHKSEILVKIGVHRLHDWSDDYIVTRMVMDIKIFEEYDPFTFQNDLSVLTLAKRVKFNQYIRPACLWSGDPDQLRIVGDTGVVAGWGARDDLTVGLRQDEPQMARMPVVSTTQCKASKSDFHALTYNTTLCAGSRNGVGPCTGDSGGGLYLLEDGKWRIRGVVSVSLRNTGYNTCNLKEYVIFTDTAQFLPWIRNILSVKYFD